MEFSIEVKDEMPLMQEHEGQVLLQTTHSIWCSILACTLYGLQQQLSRETTDSLPGKILK